MTRALGSNAIIKFCQEATWGTTPVAPTEVHGIAPRSEGLGSTRNLFQSETISPTRAVVGLGNGNKAVAGNISTDLLPEGLEVLFCHLLGQNTPVTTGSGIYTHVIKGASGYLEGLSIEKGFPNITTFFKYTGCRVNSLTINIVQEGFHEAVFDFIGKAETVDEAATMIVNPVGGVTYGTKSGFTGYQCKIYIDSVEVGEAVSGSITITNNYETDAYVLGSEFRASALPGRRECSGDFTMFFQDVNEYNTYVAGTEVALKFEFISGADSLNIEFPIVKLSGESPKVTGPGGLNLSLSFQARYSTADLTDVIFTLVNTLDEIPAQPT